MYKMLYFKNNFNFTYILWLIGFSVGVAIACNAPVNSGAIFLPPSLFGMLFSSLLPAALGILFLRFKWMKAFYVLLVTNGLVYGFSFLLLCLMFQGGSPVLRMIYFASCSSSSLCLLYVGSSCRNMNRHYFKWVSILCIYGIGVICTIHYFILTKGLS